MGVEVDERHLTGLLGTAGKSIAAMPEARRVVDQLRDAHSRDDLMFILRSADLGVDEPAREMIRDAAAKHWEDVRATLLKSAELQLHERFNANA